MPKWTPQQSNAINAENRNILVSAAAGSGKTAVLVERVIRMITDKKNPVDIDKLLIVTFTNAAAAEMKFRISKSLKGILKENPSDSNIRRQLSLISNAKICTIDSFCINLVRENFYDLGINSDFTNLDESELSLLEDGIIDDVLNDYFDKGDSEFISLIEMFTTPNNDKAIVTVLKRILRFIYAQPFPYVWFDKMTELYNPDITFEQSVWFEYLKNEISFLLEFSSKLATVNFEIISSMLTYKDKKQQDNFLTLAGDDITEISRFSNALEKSWDDLVNERPADFKRMPSSAKIPEDLLINNIKQSRDIYKKILKEDIPSFLISSKEDYKNDMKVLYPLLNKLKELVCEIDNRLMEIKLDRNAFSFSDIEHFAIQLLFNCDENGDITKTDLACSLSEHFYEILVDEYQDTNEAQDLLFTYLSNGKNLFVVGDVKQSIYRFRLAMPNIFNEKRKSYSDYCESDSFESSKIILDKNFRSRQGICSYVNFVFSILMSERVGEITYDENEYLNYGADYKDTDVLSAQIKILYNVKGENTAKKEAAYIAQTIQNKINSGELIKDGDTYRPVEYGDFVILMRSLKNRVDDYYQVLTDYGIPVICDNSTNLFDNNEIKIILSLLRTIDNPTLDIPLLATMMSPIYSFTADELAQIRIDNKIKSFYFSVIKSDNEKVKTFLDDIRNLRKLSVTMSVAGFIRYIVEDKGIISLSNAMGNGEQRYQNILKLISFADNFDKGDNVGLTSFIRYIDKIIESDKSVESASAVLSGENAVSIMSIHHSKGLEFPICIFAGASRIYNKQDLSDKLLLNTKFGFGLKRHNEENLYQFQSIPYSVIKNKNSFELMSENLRVLYVAMTRAKEQFITFVTCNDIEKKLAKLSGYICLGKVDPYICKKVTNDADFLLLCGLLHKDGGKLREISGFTEKPLISDFDMDIELKDDFDIESTEVKPEFEPYSEETLKKISDRLSYHYERAPLSKINAKMTASSLDDSENSFEFITSSKPAFLSKSEMTPAQRGTAMHTFMQFCNYEKARLDLEEEINRLKENGFITEEQAEGLDRKRLSSFFNSDFAERMFCSDRIYREIKVTSFVKADEIYGNGFDDNVLIQGIADCVFEEKGKLVLVDYKTDRVKDEKELLERYKKQIAFYKSAIEKTLQKPVKETVLYSFHLQKVCIYK